MTTFYYYPSALTVPNFQVLIDELLYDLEDSGNEILLAKCNGAIKHCESNPYGNKFICALCTKNFDLIEKKFNLKGKGVKIVDLREYISDYLPLPTQVHQKTFEELKQINYLNINIGYGVISSYVSRVRNIGIKKRTEENIVLNYFSGAQRVVHLLLKASEDIKFEKVVFYNGRLHTIRPLLNIAVSRKIHYKILEVIGGRDGTNYKKQVYYNSTPFNRKEFSQYINKNWELHSKEEQESFSEKFFKYKRKGIPIFDKSYVSERCINLSYQLRNKQRITIFNSSPDERASLGEDWEWAFEGINDQAQIVKLIVESLKDRDFEIVFRMHPNLKGYKGTLEEDLKKIERNNENFKLFTPYDQVDSYNLLDTSDFVLSFGSTIGVEATYWGKISIVIGKSFYDYLDVAYSVTNLPDLLKLLVKETSPKLKSGTLKWAVFYANRIYNVHKFKYLPPTEILKKGRFKAFFDKTKNKELRDIMYNINNIVARFVLKSSIAVKKIFDRI